MESLPEAARKLIADLRAENAAHRRAKQESEAAAKTAEDKRLEAEKQFEQLAQQRAARIAELEPIASRYESLAAKLTADMEREIAKLPAGSNGALDVAAAERTVASLLSGGSDPVITKAPEGAWTSAITDKALAP